MMFKKYLTIHNMCIYIYIFQHHIKSKPCDLNHHITHKIEMHGLLDCLFKYEMTLIPLE